MVGWIVAGTLLILLLCIGVAVLRFLKDFFGRIG